MASPARRTPPSRSTAPARTSSGFRGAEGRRKMIEEEERAAARREAAAQNAGAPFRFYCPVGETREFIIVDEEPDFFRFEHNLRNPRNGKWDIFCDCINENANCPVCKVAERPSYFAMYLTVIDLTPYETSTGESVEWSKKLLVVKPAQQKKFTRLFERHGTLRGMLISATRDGEKEASIGADHEFVEFVEEEDLLTYETQYTDKKGKVHEVVGHEVYDYDELFPASTEKMLRALVGGHAEPGSREDDDRSTGRRSTRGGDDWDSNDKRPSRSATSRRAGKTAEDDEDEAPTRRAPVRRGARAEAEPEEESEEEAPAPRRAATRTASARTAPVRGPVRRATREEEPEEEVEEDPPQRRAAPARAAPQSLAEKRRALRR